VVDTGLQKMVELVTLHQQHRAKETMVVPEPGQELRREAVGEVAVAVLLLSEEMEQIPLAVTAAMESHQR
jgi:hypothetical protein